MFNRHLFFPILLLYPIGTAKSADPAPPKSVAAILNEQFQKWDKNRDGKLSGIEIDAVVADHRVTGDDAAAAAALHCYFRDRITAIPLTHAFFEISAANPLLVERLDKAKIARQFQANFQSFRDHIRNTPRELFVGDAPQVLGIKQGGLGDCYFLGVLGATVHTNPKLVKEMFHPLEDGTCEVSFLGGGKAKVKLTDAQIALGSTAGKQGNWLNVLEQAYAQVRFARQQNKEPGQIPLDLIGLGGDPVLVVSLLTGHQSETIWIPSLTQDSAGLNKVRSALITAVNYHRVASCSAAVDVKKIPLGFVVNHCYGIVGFDAAKDIVHVWNPWGTDFQPKKQPAGLANGYPVKDGYTEMPLNEFMKVFDFVEYETPKLLKPVPKT